jgi:choice-of-anchor A domain-containing protein
LTCCFLSSVPANVVYEVLANNAGCRLTCSDNQAEAYTVNIPDSDWNTINSFTDPVNCNSEAQWVFNIGGTGTTVRFGDDTVNFRAPEYVLYNVLPVSAGARTIQAVSVKGNLLAPEANLVHKNGVWIGVVIVGSLDTQTQNHQVSCSAVLFFAIPFADPLFT